MRKTVLITGTSSGFGQLTAALFANNGWQVIATMRDTTKDHGLSDLENVLVTSLDVTNVESINKAVEKGIAKFGAIDAVVNNAGYGTYGFLEETDEEDFTHLFNTNVFGAIRVIKATLPHLRKNGGSIVNVSSIAGLIGAPMMAAYSASKFAIDGLTESLAYELNEFGISVKSVAPGGFNTNFQSSSILSLGDKKEELNASREGFIAFTSERRAKMKEAQASDPSDVAKQIYKCVTEETGLRNPVGDDCNMLYALKKSKTDTELFQTLVSMAMPPKSK